MEKADEFIKRGLIVGLAVTTIGGAVLPLNTAYAATNDNAIVSIMSYEHVGSTGHITNIKDDVRNWEYNTPQYIITDLEMPLSYANPWYSSGEDKDPAKAVKSYYYLGTIIYNDTATKETASGYDSLSDNEKGNYDDIKYYYNQKVKTSSDYNAKAEVVKKGIEFDSTDLPLIYELLTGEKFDWQYWYNKGFNDAQNYSSYTLEATGSSKVSHGVKSNYAKAVTVSGYDSKIVKTYKVIKDGEARVYVKGKKQGTTTLTIKTILNDGKTVSYKTKVTIKASNAPIKYKTTVSPLSYAAYAMEKDGANYLGYLSKYGEFYSKNGFIDTGTIGKQTGDVDVLSILPHPSLSSTASYFTGGKDFYKWNKADTSSYIKDFLENCGAFDMLDAGQSEYSVVKHVQKSILNKSFENIENGRLPQRNKGVDHYTLKGFLEGRKMACGDDAAIASGVANLLGINYYTQSIPNDVKTIVVLDGKHYVANATTMSSYNEVNNPMTLTFPKAITSHKSLADATLDELIGGRLLINITGTRQAGAGLFYKISDEYEAGRFKYGAEIAPENGSAGTAKVNNSFGVLEADKGDTRLLTLRAGLDASWDNKEQNTITFRYTVPYMERANFKLKKGATKQLNIVNSNWADWTPKTSSSKIATVNSTGKVTMKGTGTATITLTHKTIKGLSIKVLVSTSSITASTGKTKAGTFYTENDGMYTNGTHNIIAGDYMRIHD